MPTVPTFNIFLYFYLLTPMHRAGVLSANADQQFGNQAGSVSEI
jgi:hypothetical protein